jgi:hypothetical protein
MEFSSNILAFGVVLIVVLLAGGYLYTKDAPVVEGDLVTTPVSSASITEQSFITLFQQLESISLDTDFFDDLLYRSLEDISTAISPETSGKADPFRPY